MREKVWNKSETHKSFSLCCYRYLPSMPNMTATSDNVCRVVPNMTVLHIGRSTWRSAIVAMIGFISLLQCASQMKDEFKKTSAACRILKLYAMTTVSDTLTFLIICLILTQRLDFCVYMFRSSDTPFLFSMDIINS